MKGINYFLKGIIVFIFPFSAFSQSNNTSNEKDLLLRASCGSYYIEESSESFFESFKTPLGEACANIILKNFRDNLQIPSIENFSLVPEDKKKVEELIQKLNLMKKTPPSWVEIINSEERRLIEVDKAVRQKSKYSGGIK